MIEGKTYFNQPSYSIFYFLFFHNRFKFIENPEAQNPLTYNQRWVDIADTISSQLKPFMAIHWRMEQLEPVSNLLPCAEDLVDKIHQLESKGDKKIKAKHPNVFLLTDYPHLLNTTGAKPESNSFHLNQLKSEHHNAIEYLYTHLNITLTSLEDQNIPYAELPQNWHILPIDTQNATPVDRSILGIVDKLVAMRAQWFFAGKPGICAKSSSFTGRISKSREKAFKHGDENIISPLATFNLN
jgi:hypothetical protein